MKVGIFKAFKGRHKVLVDACEALNVKYEEVDIISSNWIENVQKSNCDGFMAKPPGRRDVWKRMYDEKLYFIENKMEYIVYPSYDEIFLFGNKRVVSYWLEINNIRAPKTWVFYDKNEAKRFIESYNKFPLIFKVNISSGGVGVELLKNKRMAYKLINKVFTKCNFLNFGYTKWGKKNGIPYPMLDDKQYDNILFQEYINIKWEWRGVKIGKSYFAHKKLKGKNGMYSGSGKANYDTPPIKVMDFLKKVCDIGNFNSMSVDFFEDIDGYLYVNELQTFFGSHIKPYQMCVSGKPGRYIYENDKWIFDEGFFNDNNSCNLRVLDFIEILNNKIKN
jgi:hypothetical protein